MSNNNNKNEHDEVEIEYEDEVVEESSMKDKLKKLRLELKDSKTQSQEYLTGWQKERADFANFKTEEEKKKEAEQPVQSETGMDFGTGSGK